jgi:hypothetical protein
MRANNPDSVFKLQSLDEPFHPNGRDDYFVKLKYQYEKDVNKSICNLKIGSFIQRADNYLDFGRRAFSSGDDFFQGLLDVQNDGIPVKRKFRFPIYKTLYHYKLIENITLDQWKRTYD